MADPIISWFIQPEGADKMSPAREAYAGNYNKAHDISMKFQLWNNRYGRSAVDDLSNFSIQIFFDHTEDKSLLPYCNLVVSNSTLDKQIINDRAVFNITRTLSGAINNGTATDNPENFMEFEFKFSAPKNDTVRLKENDLKNLYFEIITN